MSYGYNNVYNARDVENRLKEVQNLIFTISNDLRFNRVPIEAINSARMELMNLEKEEKDLIGFLSRQPGQVNYNAYNTQYSNQNMQNGTMYNVGNGYGNNNYSMNRYSFGQTSTQNISKPTTGSGYQTGNNGYQSKTKSNIPNPKPFEMANKAMTGNNGNGVYIGKEDLDKITKENVELRSQVNEVKKELIEMKENLKMLIKVMRAESDKPFIVDSKAISAQNLNVNTGEEKFELYQKEKRDLLKYNIEVIDKDVIGVYNVDEMVDNLNKELFSTGEVLGKDRLFNVSTTVGDEIVLRNDESISKAGGEILKLYKDQPENGKEEDEDVFATNVVKAEFKEVLEFLSSRTDLPELVRIIEEFENDDFEDNVVELDVIPEHIFSSLKYIPSEIWTVLLNIIGLEINKIGKYDLNLGVDVITGGLTYEDMKVVDNALKGNDDRMMRTSKDIDKYNNLVSKFIKNISNLIEIKSLSFEFNNDASTTLRVLRKYEAFVTRVSPTDFKEVSSNGFGLGIVVPESHSKLYNVVETMVNEKNLENGSVRGLVLVISTVSIYETVVYEVLSIDGEKGNKVFTLKRLK